MPPRYIDLKPHEVLGYGKEEIYKKYQVYSKIHIQCNLNYEFCKGKEGVVGR